MNINSAVDVYGVDPRGHFQLKATGSGSCPLRPSWMEYTAPALALGAHRGLGTAESPVPLQAAAAHLRGTKRKGQDLPVVMSGREG